MRRCALCGHKAEIIPSDGLIINDFVEGYKIICSNIGCPNDTGWCRTLNEAVSIWQDSNTPAVKSFV